MAQSGKLKDTDHYKDGAGKRHARGKRAREGKVSFEGLTFAELNGAQKDDLLRVVSIQLGIIEE